MLVKKYLVAVVSLPAGVFQPYSGVKTSVLVMDKRLAKTSDSILFVKIASDGFGLGAQRRAVTLNDLPEAKRLLAAWMESLRDGTPFEVGGAANVQVVEKTKIGAGGDYNLSAGRYVAAASINTEWPMLPLREICEFKSGLWKGEKEPLRTVKILRNTNFTKTGFLNTADVVEHPVEERQLESRRLEYGDIILEKSGGGPTQPVGRVALFNIKQGEYSYSNFTARIRVVDDRANPIFVWLLLNSLYQSGRTELMQKQTSGIRNLDNAAYQSIEIPLPPLAVQQEIVAEIEGYQKIIDGARQVVENYKPRIDVRPEWPMVEIGEVCKPEYGFTASAQDTGTHRFIRITDIGENGHLKANDAKYINLTPEAERSTLSAGDLLVARTGATFGKTMIFSGETPSVFASYLIRLRFPKDLVLPSYYWAFAQSGEYWTQAQALVTGGGQPQFNGNALVSVKFPLPGLETQRAIVAEIEEEQRLVDASKALIQRFEAKSKAAISRVWGEDAAMS